MNLFSRTVPMSGPASAVSAFALGLREYVSAATSVDIGLWAIGFGAPVGTMVYTAQVDGHAGLAALGAPLAGNLEYEAMLAKGAELIVGPPVDLLRERLDGAAPGDPPPVGSAAVLTTAVIANGKYAEGVGWGLEVAAHVTKVSGMPVAFYMDLYGSFGQVTWVAVAPDAAAVDAANARLNSDADYIGMLSAAGDLFVPGSGHRSAATRIG